MSAGPFSLPFRAIVNRPVQPLVTFDFSTGALRYGATIARNSTGVVTDSTPKLVSRPSNSARFDHDPVTSEPRGLLFEGAATNLLQHQRFTYNGSSKLSKDWEAGIGVFPTVQQFTAYGVAQHYIYAPSSAYANFSAGHEYAISTYLDSSADFAFVTGSSQIFGADQWLVCDMQAGTIVHAQNCTGFIEPQPVGWRVTQVLQAPTSGTASYAVGFSDGTNQRFPSFASTDTLTLYGVQVEAGNKPTSYIPTTGAPASRAADSLSISGWPGVFDVLISYADGTSDTLLSEVVSGVWEPPVATGILKAISLYPRGVLG